jgi:hypothetical protein
MHDFWSDEYALTDLLFETNKSLEEISDYFECSKAEISKTIKLLGLDWVRRSNKKMSRGQAALTSILQKLLPSEEIVNEYHIGERLRLDIYCPKYKVAIEYHGRQHYNHISRFHETYDDFLRAQERDQRKIELCKENGISLVIFKYSDKLDEDIVHERIIEAIKTQSQIPNVNILKSKNYSSFKNNPNYEKFKSKRKEFERELRKKIKQEKKIREQKSKKELEETYNLDEDPLG